MGDTTLSFQPDFGKYRLMKLIARGGMAEIFRALMIGPQGFAKMLAIKRMLPQFSADHVFVEMFTDEAKLVASLSHANIVKLFDFGIIDDRLYHALEYIRGKNLSEVIAALKARGTQIPVNLACQIMHNALAGLDHAHRLSGLAAKPLNIIHRDLSTSNILVAYEGAVKVADFGIAKAAQSRRHTSHGSVRGNPRFMSPEQARGMEIDQRSDLFSLGVCFYELLTLSAMYDDVDPMRNLELAQHAEFPPPRKLNPDIPRKLEKIMHRALARAPEDRYQSAEEWLQALERYLHDAKIQLKAATIAQFMTTLFMNEIQGEQEQIAREFGDERPTDPVPVFKEFTGAKVPPAAAASAPKPAPGSEEDGHVTMVVRTPTVPGIPRSSTDEHGVINLPELRLADLSPLRHRTFGHPREVVVVEFRGKYRLASEGKADSRYMTSVTRAALSAWNPRTLVLDLSALAYEWGDEFSWFCRATYPGFSGVTRAVFGPACQAAILNLTLGADSTWPLPALWWMHANTQEAIRCARRQLELQNVMFELIDDTDESGRAGSPAGSARGSALHLQTFTPCEQAGYTEQRGWFCTAARASHQTILHFWWKVLQLAGHLNAYDVAGKSLCAPLRKEALEYLLSTELNVPAELEHHFEGDIDEALMMSYADPVRKALVWSTQQRLGCLIWEGEIA